MPPKIASSFKLQVSGILTAILITAAAVLTPSLAQSPSPTQTALEKAGNDYNFQFTKYRETQEDYITARSAYFTFKTAVSKNNAFQKTKDYILQIDTLYLSFLALVQEHGNQINWGKSGAEKDELSKTINGEITYLSEHKQKIQGTKTLEELPPLAQELQTHIDDVLEMKLNKVLAIYEVVETESVLEDFLSLSRILDRVVVFKLQAGETKSILANWSSEIKNIRDRATEKISVARSDLDKAQSETLSNRDLRDISESAQEAKTELKRSLPLFEEVVRIL